MIVTPGHTPGHTSFYYRPDLPLFAGDVLVVIDGRVRFMARLVTLDLAAARKSIEAAPGAGHWRAVPWAS